MSKHHTRGAYAAPNHARQTPNQVSDTPAVDAATDNSDIADAYSAGFGEEFSEEEMFGSGNVASLEALGLADPYGDPYRNDFHSRGQPANLVAPEPRPGFVQRFVQYSFPNGDKNIKNIKRSQRNGWLPRDVSAIADKSHFPIRAVGGKAVVEIDGNVLCEMPIERARLFRERQVADTSRQTRGVEHDFKSGGERGGVPVNYDNKQTVRHGGRTPNVAPNRNATI